MKRALFQNVRVAPYDSGEVIDRDNFLSATFAAQVAIPGDLTLTITHCDTEDGDFEPAADMRLEPNDKGTFTTDGVITIGPLDTGELANIDLDLVGCKQFIKIDVSGVASDDAFYAYVLGDAQYAPV